MTVINHLIHYIDVQKMPETVIETKPVAGHSTAKLLATAACAK